MLPAADSRPTVIRPLALLGLASIVGVVFILLFPGQDFARARLLVPADELSIAYLKQVLRQKPRDDARLLLEHQQFLLGHWDDAEQTLRPALDSRKSTRQAVRIAWLELCLGRLNVLPADHIERPARQREAIAALKLLASLRLDGAHLEELAGTALALEMPSEAAELYDRLAVVDPARAVSWRTLAGRWFRAANRLDASARSYLQASAAALAETASVDALVQAVTVLQAANRNDEALTTVEGGLVRWPQASRLLDRGVRLALAIGDVPRAEHWGQLLISRSDPTDAALTRQLDLELQAGNLPAALAVTRDLVRRHPDDPDLRHREGEIATWAGKPRVALAAWAWLAARGCRACQVDALKLAHALYDYEGVSSILRTKARAGTLSLDELLDLSDALQNEGEPMEARQVLRAAESTFAEVQPYWQERTDVDEHLDDLQGALDDQRELGRRFGGQTARAEREAEFLWKLDRPQDAFEVLRKAAPRAEPDALSFWKLLAGLAWTLEEDDEALAAYRRLWILDKRDATTVERLVALSLARGDQDDVLRIGREGFDRFGSPTLLVAAIDAAIESERWDEARTMFAEGDRAHADVFDQGTYWSSLGQLAMHDGDPRRAAKAFARAETLDPAAPGLHEDLRWARIEAGQERDPEEEPDGSSRDDDASDRLDAAVRNHDRTTIRAILKDDGATLTASERIDAERELGDEDRAWAMVNAAPRHSDDPEEDAAIALERDEMAGKRLGGAWASANAQSLGDVSLIGEEARSERRFGATRVGLLAGHTHLLGGGTLVAPNFSADEWRSGATIRMADALGDAKLDAGGQFLPTGALPYASAVQMLEPTRWMSIEIAGAYHTLPTDTAALRVAGLRDELGAEVDLRIGDSYTIEAGGDAHRYEARAGDSLANGWTARASVARILRAAHPILRLRVDGFVEANRLATTLPSQLVSMFVADTDVSDVVPATHATTGVGLTLLDREDNDLGTGEGCTRCLRPFADVWAGWLMPTNRVTYSAEAGLGFVFARWQELTGAAFYFSDRGGEPGQRYTGASLSYILRWL